MVIPSTTWEWIKTNGLEESFDKLNATVIDDGQLWHYDIYCSRIDKTGPTWRQPVTKLWADCKGPMVCAICKGGRTLRGEGPNFAGTLHVLAEQIEHVETAKKRAPRTAATLLSQLTNISNSVRKVADKLGVDEKLEACINELLDGAQKAVTTLKVVTTSDSTRQKIENVAKNGINGPKNNYPVDDTPTIVAWCQKPGQGPSQAEQLKAIAGAYGIGNPARGQVVLVPAFLAQWMMRASLIISRAIVSAQTVATDSLETLELAANLWDIDCGGPLASISGAVIAARELTNN